MGNLDKWNKMCQAPDWALTPITGGRLKGKTDINPTWRMQCLTENYGEYGIGWYYEIVKTWENTLDNKEIAVFVLLNLYVKNGNEWSKPIPSIGGDMMAQYQFNSYKGVDVLFVNDDCYKMATTDALGKAALALGVAANTYRKSDTKYNRPSQQQEQPKPKSSQPVPAFPNLAKLQKELDIGIKAGYQTAIEKWLNDNQLDLSVVTEAEAEKMLQKLIKERGTFKKDVKNG